MNNFNYNKLTPFKWFVLENFPFIEADFDAITDWQLFCKLGKEINKLINNTNTLGGQVESLTDYVLNYFDNLNVQEEINNKLDEMAENGTLEEIITEYLNVKGILAFNTIAEMQNATNIINGSFVKTYGKINYNDGMGEFYKIREIQNTDVVDGINIISITTNQNLIAELIKNKLLDEINVKVSKIENDWLDPLNYGAVGDGITDDYQAIQYCINNGNVRLSKGRFYISQSLEIKENMIFDGGNQVIIPAYEKPAFKGIGTTNEPIRETVIKNVQIETTDIGGYGIYLENGYFNYFDNINIIKLKGINAYGFKLVNGFNQVVSNSRVYGDYENYSGQIGIDISTTSGYMSNETNNKYDTLLLQNIDYGVKANYSVTANMIQFNNIGFSSCKYCFYMEGTALPISIDNTRMEGASRNDSEEIYGFYLKGGIRPTINTFNAYNINNVIHTELSMLTLIGNIALTGTNQSPKYNFFSSSSTGKVMNLATLYSLGTVYDGSTPTTLYLTNSKDIEDGTNNTSTLNAYQTFNRIVKQTSQYIAYVRGKKGSIVYAWTDESNLVIRGKTNKPDTTNQFDADVNMVKGKMYKFYLIDDDMSVLLD